MRGTDSPDSFARRFEFMTMRGTDGSQPIVVKELGGWVSHEEVCAALMARAQQPKQGKPRIGKHKRNKVRAKMARASKRTTRRKRR